MSINWEKMVARWDEWARTTVAALRVKAAAGDAVVTVSRLVIPQPTKRR